jgi:hypothetical protein
MVYVVWTSNNTVLQYLIQKTSAQGVSKTVDESFIVVLIPFIDFYMAIYV